MGLPTYEDNLIGYENGSLLDKVDKIKGKRFQVNQRVLMVFKQHRAFKIQNVHKL